MYTAVLLINMTNEITTARIWHGYQKTLLEWGNVMGISKITTQGSGLYIFTSLIEVKKTIGNKT